MAEEDEGKPESAEEEGAPVVASDAKTEETLVAAAQTDPITLTAQTLGRLVLGEVRISFADRDVTWAMDWTAARRLLGIYARRGKGDRGDTLDAQSDPFAAWMVLDTETVVAMAWAPGIPARADRTTIDPHPVIA